MSAICINGTFIRNNYRIFRYDFFSFETISNLNNYNRKGHLGKKRIKNLVM